MAAYAFPKHAPLLMHDSYVGYYRGLGLHNGEGYLGKDYYRIVATEPGNGYWQVEFDSPGYNEYRGFYPDGTLRESGKCLVVEKALQPLPDRNDVLVGKYYSPDGQLVSEVMDGSGIQMLYYPTGQKSWELQLVNGRRKSLSTWHDNGQLSHVHEYLAEDLQEFVTYYEDGRINNEGRYAKSKESQTWEYTYTIRSGVKIEN